MGHILYPFLHVRALLKLSDLKSNHVSKYKAYVWRKNQTFNIILHQMSNTVFEHVQKCSLFSVFAWLNFVQFFRCDNCLNLFLGGNTTDRDRKKGTFEFVRLIDSCFNVWICSIDRFKFNVWVSSVDWLELNVWHLSCYL